MRGQAWGQRARQTWKCMTGFRKAQYSYTASKRRVRAFGSSRARQFACHGAGWKRLRWISGMVRSDDALFRVTRSRLLQASWRAKMPGHRSMALPGGGKTHPLTRARARDRPLLRNVDGGAEVRNSQRPIGSQ